MKKIAFILASLLLFTAHASYEEATVPRELWVVAMVDSLTTTKVLFMTFDAFERYYKNSRAVKGKEIERERAGFILRSKEVVINGLRKEVHKLYTEFMNLMREWEKTSPLTPREKEALRALKKRFENKQEVMK